MMFAKVIASLLIADAGRKSTYISMARSFSSMQYERVGARYADVHIVPMFSDNYGYIIVDKSSGATACVDPGDDSLIASALNELKLDLNMILCTHKHADHVGGNIELKKLFPAAQVVGTKYEFVPGLERPVGDGDIFQLGSLDVTVRHTPCHTKGHIVFIVTPPKSAERQTSSEAPLLFCGDTLFVGGCGRFFEGTASEMLSNMDILGSLPAATQVFGAHEYTESNLRFLAHVDPQRCTAVYDKVKQMRAAGKITIPSTIGEELQYNLFMKCRDSRTQELVDAVGDAQAAMVILRSMKNNF